jgi:hexosaminidase
VTVAEHLATRGRTLAGWSEITEGGASANAVVMTWRSEDDLVSAAAAGHDMVATVQEWLCFDRPYSDDRAEPPSFPGAISVEKVYGFDPVPAPIPSDRRQEAATPPRSHAELLPRLTGRAPDA